MSRNRPDMLGSFDILPGGALMSRRIEYWWNVSEFYKVWADEFLQKEAIASRICPLFPSEYATPEERGAFVLHALAVGEASEKLQAIATDPATHPPLRSMAAHRARFCLLAAVRLFAKHQTLLNMSPQTRTVFSGPLAVVWVSAGVIRWEVNQFETVERDGDLILVADLPHHLSTVDQLRVWTEAHCVDESASLTSVA